MLRNFPSPKDVYRIRSPKNFYAAMRADVQLLLENERYLALTTVIMCCLDALAADPGDAGRGKFGSFMERHFPELCTLLDSVCPVYTINLGTASRTIAGPNRTSSLWKIMKSRVIGRVGSPTSMASR